MNINLRPDLEKAIQKKVRLGHYASAKALVHEAVQRLVESEREEQEHTEQIRSRILVAEAEIDRGEYTEYDERSLADLPRNVRERNEQRLRPRTRSGRRG